jgi:hypothetical protein
VRSRIIPGDAGFAADTLRFLDETPEDGQLLKAGPQLELNCVAVNLRAGPLGDHRPVQPLTSDTDHEAVGLPAKERLGFPETPRRTERSYVNGSLLSRLTERRRARLLSRWLAAPSPRNEPVSDRGS